MRDGELPEISVLGSNCLMAKEEFGTVVATEDSLPPSRPSRPVRSDLGLNPEACRSIWSSMNNRTHCYAHYAVMAPLSTVKQADIVSLPPHHWFPVAWTVRS